MNLTDAQWAELVALSHRAGLYVLRRGRTENHFRLKRNGEIVWRGDYEAILKKLRGRV